MAATTDMTTRQQRWEELSRKPVFELITLILNLEAKTVDAKDDQRLIRTLYQQRADLRARVRDVEAVAESMRERAARTVMSYTDGLDDLAGEVEDLPLFPDAPARTPLTADTDT